MWIVHSYNCVLVLLCTAWNCLMWIVHSYNCVLVLLCTAWDFVSFACPLVRAAVLLDSVAAFANPVASLASVLRCTAVLLASLAAFATPVASLASVLRCTAVLLCRVAFAPRVPIQARRKGCKQKHQGPPPFPYPSQIHFLLAHKLHWASKQDTHRRSQTCQGIDVSVLCLSPAKTRAQ